MNEPRRNFAREQRLRMIDFLLDRFGMLNRGDLIDYFGISMQQASLDIRDYLQLAPGNAEYDKTAKTYRRAPAFVRLMP